MTRVTNRVVFLINKFFSVRDSEFAISLLAEQCGNNLPLCEKWTLKELDRIRFAVIKISDGNIEELKSAVKLAKIDWRDLLVNVGFAKDINSHNIWADTALF